MNQRQKYSEMVKQRHLKLSQETLKDNLIVLSKFREQYGHLLYPFQDKIWNIDCIPNETIDNPLEKIIKAQCNKIHFAKLVDRFLIFINIPKSLSMIIFPKLAELNLKNNFISSIQPFYQLRAPQLIYLYLNENLITNIRVLRKCNFPRLWLIDLRTNPIPNFDYLFQMELDSISYLMLRGSSDYERHQWCQSQRGIANQKIPSILIHPSPDINFIFKIEDKTKTKSNFVFLLQCQSNSNPKKRQLLRLKSLRT